MAKGSYYTLHQAMFAQELYVWWAIQNQLNSIVSLSEAVLVAAAGKAETSHQPLQVSNLPIHMYHALQMMKAKVLPMNLEGEIFVVD